MLPIGYWIKKLDELLTNGINEIQAALKMTRTEWQILNSIHEKALIAKSELTNLMKPFAGDDMVQNILTRFISKDIVKIEKEIFFTLTEKGT